MKQCPHCGTEISDSASICDLCVERTAESAIRSAGYPPASQTDYSTEPYTFTRETSSRDAAYATSGDALSDYTSEPNPSADYPSSPVTEYGADQATSAHADSAPATVTPPVNLAAAAAGVAAASSGRHTKQRDRKLMAVGVGVIGISVILGLLIASSGTPTGPAPDGANPTQVTSAPARRLAQTPPLANQVTATFKSKWNSTNRDWVGNQRRAIAFELASENKVAVWQRQVQLMLVVRCMANRIDAFVFTQSPAKMEPQDNDHTVRVAFDGEPEKVQRWPDSDEHDALFAPDGAAFAQRLASAKTMTWGFTPHNASPVSTIFNVAGLAELMAPAAKQCAVKK